MPRTTFDKSSSVTAVRPPIAVASKWNAATPPPIKISLVALVLAVVGCPDGQDMLGEWHCGATCPAKDPASCEATIGTGSDASKGTARSIAKESAMQRAKSGCDYGACTVDCRMVGQ